MFDQNRTRYKSRQKHTYWALYFNKNIKNIDKNNIMLYNIIYIIEFFVRNKGVYETC